MSHAILIPRVNNNDDEVRLIRVLVGPGKPVAVGQALVEVETDKATISIETDRGGYVLRMMYEEGRMIPVGSVLAWIGESPDDTIPDDVEEPGASRPRLPSAEPTAKARALIAQYGLDFAEIPARGGRLTVEDVEEYIKARDEIPSGGSPAMVAAGPAAAGRLVALSMEERGMLRSVLWHRDEAVPAYLEIEYDHHRWEEHAKVFASERRLLGDPLLPLMAQRLATIAVAHPKLNSTVVDGQRHVYEDVNLGFTIQVQEILYLVVIQRAGAMDPPTFVEALGRLHRKAIAHRLGAEEVQGATVAFSSMARWRVARHVPILPPFVSMIVAHTISGDGRSILGATYDHRVLSGGDTVAVLNQVAQPVD